jgi:serine/threonine-protein kinase
VSATTGIVLSGRYRLEHLIAAGGMGEVWRAHDETLGRAVAVKLMHAQLSAEPGFLARFRGEARNTAALSHPGIATVHDYGEVPADGGATRAYLVMELVEGRPLSDVLESAGRLPADRVLDLVAQVASALTVAHAAGVVHRDIKPANLLVRPDGRVVVTDFGIARTVGAAGSLTVTGEVMGTASYLAPEQAAGRPPMPATDVYALGVVAYECLAGRRPFDGGNPVMIALAHLRDTAPPLPADVPAPARALVERAMAKDPADRYASATALVQAARAAVRAAAPAGPPVTPGTTTRLPSAAASGRAPRAAVGHASVPGVPPPVPATAAPRSGALLRRPSALVSGVAAGVVIALLLGVGITSLLHRSAGSAADVAGGAASPAVASQSPAAARSGRAPATVAVRSTTPAPAPAPVLTLRPADYVGLTAAQARAKLERLDLRVAERAAADRGWPGRVVGLSPTRVRAGDTVTLSVAAWSRNGPKADRGKGKNKGDDEDQQGDD